jgi:succinate-acetate transporter protein
MAFLMLAIGYCDESNEIFIKVGGYFGLIASLLAWYNAFAEVLNVGNSYIPLPLGQFPWAEKGRLHIDRRSPHRYLKT